MRYPLRLKLWVLLAAASALPLAFLGAALAPAFDALLEERAAQALRLRAEGVTRQIQGLVDRGREDVLILSRLHPVRARLGEGKASDDAQAETEAALVVFASNRPSYERYAISDAAGAEVARVERQSGIFLPAEPRPDGEMTRYHAVECRGLTDGLVHVAAHGWPDRERSSGPAAVGTAPGEEGPTIRYCTGIYGEAPGRLGHAQLELSGERLLRTLDPELAGATVQLHDAAGEVLAERRPDGRFTLGGRAPAAENEAGSQERFRADADRVEVVVPVRSNPDRGRPNWWVRVTVSPDAVFAPGRRMVRGAALAGGLMLLLALIAGTWAAAQATAPLSELAAASRRLADGDWSVSTVARTGDEIEELARDFSAMAAALRDKEARVLEQQHLLHRSERLAVLGRFAAEVAHEVGNPLAAMKASLQALQEESQSIPPEDPRFEQLVRQIDRLDRILRGLLRSARRAPAEGATCDVGETVRAVGALLQAQAARAGVTLAVDAPVPSRAAMDGEQLQQVVFNLVANALDATKPGGRVTVAAGERDGSVELTVADNGRGIPEEDRARLFEPFFTTRPDGTGLGLAVAEQIVRENGGRLIVDSTVGIGSTFTVALPRATGEG